MRTHGDMNWRSDGPPTGGLGDRNQRRVNLGGNRCASTWSIGKIALFSTHLQGQDAEAGEGGQAARRQAPAEGDVQALQRRQVAQECR